LDGGILLADSRGGQKQGEFILSRGLDSIARISTVWRLVLRGLRRNWLHFKPVFHIAATIENAADAVILSMQRAP
jgi:hypothetical protein